MITTKPGKMYLHLLEWPAHDFAVVGLKSKVERAYLLADPARKALALQQDDTLHVSLPSSAPDPDDSVLALETAGEPQVITGILEQQDGTITLPGTLADIHHASGGSPLRLDSRGVIERWLNKDEWLGWQFQLSKPGAFA
ncbi:MAG: hypothetical protein ACR2NN_19790 [Bryobacteraceae bacterium]